MTQASGLGDGPVRSGVVEAQSGKSAQVQRGGAVMQPVIIFGDAPVADFPVVASQPSDGAFDHWPMLTILVEPVRVSRLLTGSTLQRVVGAQLQGFTPEGSGAACPQGTAAAGNAEHDVAAGGDGPHHPAGQVTRRLVSSTTKSSTVKPPATAERSGAGLTRSALAAFGQLGAELAGPVRRIGQHRHRCSSVCSSASPTAASWYQPRWPWSVRNQ